VTRFALTFDDGPGPSTAALLDVLAAAGVRATFFVLGRNLAEAPWTDPPGDVARARQVTVRALREGHILGNHSFSHAHPDRWRELPDEIRRTDELIRGLQREAGRSGAAPDAPIPFRLPYGVRLVERTIASDGGTVNAATLDPRLGVLASLGRTHVHWTSDFDDWTLSPMDAPALAAGMLLHVEQNRALGLDAVLDLHDAGTGSRWGYARPATVAAVAELLAQARRRGIETFQVP
jgi:peptidoglycan-N-acetylglucosamine deacetylase